MPGLHSRRRPLGRDFRPRTGDGRAYARLYFRAWSEAGLYSGHPHARRSHLGSQGTQVQDDGEDRDARESSGELRRHKGRGRRPPPGRQPFGQVHPYAGTRQGPCLRNAAWPHPHCRRLANRVLRRTDLPNSNAVRQYHTLYYTYRALPEDLLVYPGHDYNGREHSILKEEKESNPKMRFDTEEEFVEYMERENPAKLTPVYHLADALKANMA